MRRFSAFDPELRRTAAWLPRLPLGPVSIGMIQGLQSLLPARKTRTSGGVDCRDEAAPGLEGRAVRLQIYRPRGVTGQQAAILWLHGGGYVLGRPEDDDAHSRMLCRSLGVTVVAPAYRLAPRHPFPAALDDAWAALAWLSDHAADLEVDAARLAIGGRSAGAGLAAGLALVARDRQGPSIAYQLLLYPMLDDRTAWTSAMNRRVYPLWSPNNNRFAWNAYLGGDDRPLAPSAYAAPTRATSLFGLPRTWLGIGDQDLFHGENLAYASQLQRDGVACRLHVARGAFHGFDLVAPRAGVSRAFVAAYMADLADALLGSGDHPASNSQQDQGPRP